MMLLPGCVFAPGRKNYGAKYISWGEKTQPAHCPSPALRVSESGPKMYHVGNLKVKQTTDFISKQLKGVLHRMMHAPPK